MEIFAFFLSFCWLVKEKERKNENHTLPYKKTSFLHYKSRIDGKVTVLVVEEEEEIVVVVVVVVQ